MTENLECFADLYEVPDADDRIDRALQAVNLADRAHDACGNLSKGLRQRVALARALLSDPEVLFLDEPTSGLDPVAARDVHELIDGLRQRGVTIFLTTHRLEEAERLCDRVAILNTTLRTIGRPDELRDQLFAKTLMVKTAAPLPDPAGVFAGLPAVERLAPGRLRQLRPRRVRPGRRRAGRHPGAGGSRRRRAVDQRVAALARGRLPRADRRRRGGEPQMSVSKRRVRAIFRKELREYRRNGSIVVSHGVFPLIFLIQPLITVLHSARGGRERARHTSTFCCTCWRSRRSCPARSPPTRWSASASRARSSRCSRRRSAARSSCWARRWRRSSRRSRSRMRCLVLFLACVELFAQPGVASALLQAPDLLAQVIFTPLLAAWSIWVGIAISARCSDIRVAAAAQLAREPPVGRSDNAPRAQRDPRHVRTSSRRRGAAAGSRHARLADHLGGVRPRTSHHRHPLTR